MANEKQQKIKIGSKRKDINFFALKKVKRKTVDIAIPPWIISILVPSLVIAVIASIYVYNQSEITRLQNELAASELQIEHANVDKQRPYMAKKTVERDIFSTYYHWISNLNSQFEYFKNVQSQIPDSITAATENLVEINSFAAADGSIKIVGTSASMTNIAEFQRKCMDIEDIDNAFVSKIERIASMPLLTEIQVDEIYSFEFSATFKSRNNMMKEANE